MVGRVAEQKKLAKVMDSKESEFVAVYGRRRIGVEKGSELNAANLSRFRTFAQA